MVTRSARYSDLQIIDVWLQSQASAHTQGCYRRDYERLLEHVCKPLVRITLGDLHSFAQSLLEAGLAPVSRARTLAATKSLFGFCHRMRYVPANPAAELPLPRYENQLAERIMTEEDVRRVLAFSTIQRDGVLLQLLYGAGLRLSEACHLRWRNLRPNGDSGQLTAFGKNGKTRTVALPATLWSELISLRGAASAEDPVFPSRSGKALDRGRVRTILRAAAAEAGVAVKVSPHWLRLRSPPQGIRSRRIAVEVKIVASHSISEWHVRIYPNGLSEDSTLPG